MATSDEYPQEEIFAKMFSPIQESQGDEPLDIKSVSEHHSEQENVGSQDQYEPLDDETRKEMSENKRKFVKGKRAKGCKPGYINKKKDDRAQRKEDAKQDKAQENDMELFHLYAKACYANGVADALNMND